MSLSSILMGIIISSIYGAVFHLIVSGNLGRLLLYILLAWIGFWIGQIVGNHFGWTFLSLGVLRLGTATIGSVVTLVIGYWLSLVEKK
jgi:uncharacterized membrane protein YeaQ/YmgE (transglycosylase-associated protein family)